MGLVEPLPGEPAAVADLADERLLLIADFHAGFEAGVRFERGIELQSRAPERKQRVLELLSQTSADRLVILGDVTHSIGEPGGAERGELEVLLEAIDVPVFIAKGNHDGILEEVLATDPAGFGRVEVSDTVGARLGDLAVAHGHTWPDPALFDAEVLCIGHEHPCVRLEDDVGGRRVERVWFRGRVDPTPFSEYYDTDVGSLELIVFPAFNELCGGTWINVPQQSFLAPFLPEALPSGDVYLLNGTYLGDYRDV